MSFQNPAYRTLRRTVVGMEGMHSKMFDPPTESPATPDRVNPTNPVPEVMAAAGYLDRNPPSPLRTVQRQLMHGMKFPTWDGQEMMFFLFRDPDGVGAAKDGAFPAPTIRMPRGVIYHCETKGSGPPPHTIHWHGHEPTPMNDGVGHCSMEIGDYIYQFQPNFIGSYFHHCHRNTTQHFEFGLYGFTIIDPPDAFFASIVSTNGDGSIVLNNVPIGNGRPEPGFPLGRRRIAANLNPSINPEFAKFGQDNFNLLDSPDPEANNPNLPAWLKFSTDPHAYTVPYDVEALWVIDDRDINWSELAPNARATYPKEGSLPGVNDDFYGNAGGGPLNPGDFFAFNDFRSTHFYVTGVPVPDNSGTLRIPGEGELPHGVTVPPELMSGVSGVQVSVNGQVNQNILLRILNAAYNNIRVAFPVDIVIIAWDGRSLGVPPYGSYNEPVVVPAGTPMEWSVARRFDCLIRSDVPVNDFAIVEFIDTVRRDVRFTARIPINIGAGQDIRTFAVSGRVTSTAGAPLAGITVSIASVSLGGSEMKTAVTDALGSYTISGLTGGMYEVMPAALPGVTVTPPMNIVTLSLDGAIGVDFVLSIPAAVGYSISGAIMERIGRPLSGASMKLRQFPGTANMTVLTDAAGRFSFTGVANGRYIIEPTLAGYGFTPGRMIVRIRGRNVTMPPIKARAVRGRR